MGKTNIPLQRIEDFMTSREQIQSLTASFYSCHFSLSSSISYPHLPTPQKTIMAKSRTLELITLSVRKFPKIFYNGWDNLTRSVFIILTCRRGRGNTEAKLVHRWPSCLDLLSQRDVKIWKSCILSLSLGHPLGRKPLWVRWELGKRGAIEQGEINNPSYRQRIT